MMIPDYNITITVRNNYLLSAMLECGFSTALSLAKAANVPPQTVGQYLNLKKSPIGKRGLNKTIRRISQVLRRLPEDLFPSQHIETPLKRNRAALELNREQIEELVWRPPDPHLRLELSESKEHINAALQALDSREVYILRARFGFDGEEQTYTELGDGLGLTKERVRQIESRAIEKMKKYFRRSNFSNSHHAKGSY